MKPPRALRFTSLQLTRILGIERGEGFSLEELAAGVNLVIGPNGSGKTTCARAFQALLWPGAAGLHRPTISGVLSDGERDWRIQIEAGDTLPSNDGAPLPDFGAAHRRACYLLALHDLMVDRNEDFAKRIADLSQGGYDVDASAAKLGYSENPSLPSKLSKELAAAERDVDEAQRRQRALADRERSLADLDTERRAAIEAEAEVRVIEAARKLRDAEDEIADLERELRELPAAVEHVRGNEIEALETVERRLARLRDDLAEDEKAIADAERELAKLADRPHRLTDEMRERLAVLQRDIEKVETEHRTAIRSRAGAEAACNSARCELGGAARDTSVAARVLGSDELGEIQDFADRSYACQRRRDDLGAARRRLEAAQAERGSAPDISVDSLNEAIAAMGRWLASPKAPQRRTLRRCAVALALLACGLAGALAVLVSPWWAVAILLSAGIAIFGWQADARTGAEAETARRLERDRYFAAGAPEPEAWTIGSGAAHLRTLIAMMRARSAEDERRRSLRELDAELAELDGAEQAIAAERAEIGQRLGLELPMADVWLPTFARNLARFGEAETTLAKLNAEIGEIEAERTRTLAAIGSIIASIGMDAPVTAEEARARIAAACDEEAARQDAENRKSASEDRVRRSTAPAIEAATKERDEIFRRLGLESGDRTTLSEWIDLRPRLNELQHALAGCRRVRDDLRRELNARHDLLEATAPDLEAAKRAKTTQAAQRDELEKSIAEVRAEVAAAKRGHEVSAALEARDAAAARLEDERRRTASLLAGGILTRWLMTAAVQRSRPQVFRRAGELLASVTAGALSLELDDRQSPPAFCARRDQRRTAPLDELSAGERVQTLLAVRLAYLEHEESAALPLFLDEALGTSDDERAARIIDTVAEIARQGRQVFYFSAQGDEVAKWIRRLKEEDISHRVIDLAEVRGLAARRAAPLHIPSPKRPSPPAPNGSSHADYGRLLEAPGIDPSRPSIDDLHLWHVIEDSSALHALLCSGVTVWRQLDTLLSHGGAAAVGLTGGQIASIRAAARAAEEICRNWRIGRGRPVTRDALLDSRCVTDKFIDDVARLADDCRGDAREILRRLQKGAVPRWRAKNTEALEGFFEEHEFLASVDPLARDEIRIRTLAACAAEIEAGSLKRATVARLAGSLPE